MQSQQNSLPQTAQVIWLQDPRQYNKLKGFNLSTKLSFPPPILIELHINYISVLTIPPLFKD